MATKKTLNDCGGYKPLPLLKPKKESTKKKQEKTTPKKRGS